MKQIFALLITILCMQVLIAEEAKPEILFPDHHLCLEASGKVIMKADKAVFTFTSNGYGPSLREAVTKAKTRVSDITKALNAIGIGNECFATGSFATGKNLNSSFLTDKKDYSASLTTTVSLRDLTKLDEAVLILTDKKVENLSNISFSLDDQAKARQHAREIALSRICEQRDSIVSILGTTVTDVLLIDEAPFEQLPWNTQPNYNFNMNDRTSSMNNVKSYVNYEAEPDLSSASGGLYSPDVTVETQVRVLYRIGLKATK